MTPLQSNKAAPNKNNNKKKKFPAHNKKKIRQFLILSGIYFCRKNFVWKIYFKPHAYKIYILKLYTKLNQPTKSKQYLKCYKV